MVAVWLIVAIILAVVEAIRSKSLGWAAVAALALALLWPQVATLK